MADKQTQALPAATCRFNPAARLKGADGKRLLVVTDQGGKPLPDTNQPTLGSLLLQALESGWARTREEQMRGAWVVGKITDALDRGEEYQGGTIATPLLQAALERFNAAMLEAGRPWPGFMYDQAAAAVGLPVKSREELAEELDALDAVAALEAESAEGGAA